MTAAVQVVNATKSFGTNQVLDGLDFSAERGKVTVIIGPSGSGKSTLLRVINHLERLDTGCVSVDGELIGVRVHRDRLQELSERAILKQRARIGFVFQHFNLFPNLTVLDNIVEAPVAALGVERGQADRRARDLLARVGLADRADAFPVSFPAVGAGASLQGLIAATTKHGDGLAKPLTDAINYLITHGQYARWLAAYGLRDEAVPASSINPPGLPLSNS